MTKATLFLTLLLVANSGVASAQNYNYGYGGGRVVMQGSSYGGLATPSSTYIGSGTVSKSAQGQQAGMSNNNGLPAVNLGAHVRTPGDNMYQGSDTERQENGALIYKDQAARMQAMQRAQIMRQQAAMRRNQVQQQQGTLYIPGSNGAGATYGSAPQPQFQMNGSTANYGMGSGYGKGSATRNF